MPEGQKSLIIWDDIRAHATDVVISCTNALDIVIAEVPKNLTHLLAPLDLTVNKSLKSFEQSEFSKYYSECISSALRSNPDAPIEDTKVDVRLSVVKPLHAKTMSKAYNLFATPEGKKVILGGWRGAGIQEAVRKARDGQAVDNLIDPFNDLSI